MHANMPFNCNDHKGDLRHASIIECFYKSELLHFNFNQLTDTKNNIKSRNTVTSHLECCRYQIPLICLYSSVFSNKRFEHDRRKVFAKQLVVKSKAATFQRTENKRFFFVKIIYRFIIMGNCKHRQHFISRNT